LTYPALAAEADAAAVALQAEGVGRGDRVVMSLAGDVELIVGFLACQRIGAVWVGVNRELTAVEKTFVVEDVEATLVVADDAAALRGLHQGRSVHLDGTQWAARVAAFAGVRPEVAPIDPVELGAIAYTSGTTGRPKGACHSQHSLMTFVAAGLHGLGREGGDPYWRADARRSVGIPLTILNGMAFGPLAALAGGGTYVCILKPDSASVVDAIETYGIEVISTVATTIHDIIHQTSLANRRLSSLTAVAGGGAPVSRELKQAFRERFGIPLFEDYGMAESPCALVRSTAEDAVPGEVGRAYPHVEVVPLDVAGTPVPAGEIGELAARAVSSGPWAGVYTGMLGYWRRPVDTSNVLRDGWLHTGDLATVDNAGVIRIVGRQKDVILRGGANVYPPEVETVLASHPAVQATAVLGWPDERLGEIVVAHLELVPGEAERAREVVAELLERCVRELARYKIPERWLVVDAMPRNSMRKIDKIALRAAAAEEIWPVDNAGSPN